MIFCSKNIRALNIINTDHFYEPAICIPHIFNAFVAVFFYPVHLEHLHLALVMTSHRCLGHG